MTSFYLGPALYCISDLALCDTYTPFFIEIFWMREKNFIFYTSEHLLNMY